jgi:hypothetical protein
LKRLRANLSICSFLLHSPIVASCSQCLHGRRCMDLEILVPSSAYRQAATRLAWLIPAKHARRALFAARACQWRCGIRGSGGRVLRAA